MRLVSREFCRKYICKQLVQTERKKAHRVAEGLAANTGLFKMIVGVLTTCHTQYT